MGMAASKGVEVEDVVKSGPGLAFLVYPEVVLTIAPSPLWAFLFFVMLLTLGIDSQFCGVESLMTGLVDNWPHILQPHRKKFTLAMTVFMFILGLPMITRNGIYVFQLMDFYAASGMSLLWCVFFQTIAICWVFGAKRFYGCIEEMIGYKVSYYWFICWVLLAPHSCCSSSCSTLSSTHPSPWVTISIRAGARRWASSSHSPP